MWITYVFGTDDTTITIENTGTQAYTISQVKIDPKIQFTNGNPQLENRLLINFDSD